MAVMQTDLSRISPQLSLPESQLPGRGQDTTPKHSKKKANIVRASPSQMASLDVGNEITDYFSGKKQKGFKINPPNAS